MRWNPLETGPAKVKIKILTGRFTFPSRGTVEAAGWDLYIPFGLDGEVIDFKIKPGETVKIPLGFAMEIPKGYYVSILARSSLHKRNLMLPNAMGIIDSDYRGEVCLLLTNFGKGKESVQTGDKLAQMILHRHHEFEFEVTDELSNTRRGTGGFGSTG